MAQVTKKQMRKKALDCTTSRHELCSFCYNVCLALNLLQTDLIYFVYICMMSLCFSEKAYVWLCDY